MLSSWPFAASLAVAFAARGVHGAHRRRVLNEALHELRRPLQALALAPSGAAPAFSSSLRTAGAALERLDREINGGAPTRHWRSFPVGPLLDEVAGRWRAGGGRAAAALELCWAGLPVELEGDRGEIERALDNLLANAFEHGGPRVAIAALRCGDRLRLAVVDRGIRPTAPIDAPPGAGALTRLSGRSRRGHGLRIVRGIATAHGGRFELRRNGSSTEAVLELPLAARSGVEA